jgi:WD40 repeat protein
VAALTELPNGNLATGSRSDTVIKVWNVSTGHLDHILTGHTNWVEALTVLPDGSLANASYDTTIRVWNI